jgi:hypothetical protein
VHRLRGPAFRQLENRQGLRGITNSAHGAYSRIHCADEALPEFWDVGEARRIVAVECRRLAAAPDGNTLLINHGCDVGVDVNGRLTNLNRRRRPPA